MKWITAISIKCYRYAKEGLSWSIPISPDQVMIVSVMRNNEPTIIELYLFPPI